MWNNSLAVPAAVASVSAVLLLLHTILTSSAVKVLYVRLFAPDPIVTDGTDSELPVPKESVRKSRITEHIASLGGPVIFIGRCVRLVCCLALLALSIYTVAVPPSSSHSDAWLNFSLCGAYAYTSLLAIVSVSQGMRLSKLACRHLSTILVVTWGVYVYRDVWPYATFILSPADAEGWQLWTKIILLSVAGVAVPLLTPQQYIPIDPNNPMDPIPEQTVSIFSLTLYFFMDALVMRAWRTKHISIDELPPLADYDNIRHLVKRSFRHLDPFQVKKERHLFWGLMKVFYKEYIVLFFMVIIKVVSTLASPVGINQLLHYLETGGRNATVRPWVWISWLFLGPTLGSIAFQWYIFINTRTMVRAEAIITSLVFEHSLRIRVKAETNKSADDVSGSTSAVDTPETASVIETTGDGESAESSTASEDETLRASSASVVSRTEPDRGKTRSASRSDGDKAVTRADDTTKNVMGKLNNLVTVDTNKIINSRDFLMLLEMVPLQTGLSIWFLYSILGWSALVGLATMLVLFPLPGYLASLTQKVQREKMKRTDARVQTVTDTMSVIRMVKLFGWEPRTAEQIASKRDNELVYQRKYQLLNLTVILITYIIPLAVMLTTFMTYTVIMKQELTASKVFSSMAAFDLLSACLHRVLGFIPMLIQGKVSLERVGQYLYKTELLDRFSQSEEELRIPQPESSSDVIRIREAAFTWTHENDGTSTPRSQRRKFTLRVDDELVFERGHINLVLGPTGSGKTSLLMALLGEMHYIPAGANSSVHLPREGGVAYAAQESWVQNETIRENILFGSPYNEERYNKVIHQCALKRDLSLFDAGDQTEVGEKGLTLSGGQKARVTLARAIYSAAETLLLDDILAALDVHTAKWIVDKCLKGDLVSGRTVILVTHNVALASPIAHFVVSMSADGRIASQGSLAKILAVDSNLSAQLAEESKKIEKAEEQVDDEDPDVSARSSSDGKLIVDEEIAVGHIGWPALKLYLFGLGGNHPYLFWATVIITFFVADLTGIIQTWFLGYWAQQYEDHEASEVKVAFYLYIYSALLVLVVSMFGLGYTNYIFGTLRASRKIHRELVTSVLGTTLRWLDKTPVSRIITRCTQDIDAVDGPVADMLSTFLDITADMVVKFGGVIVFSPLFIIPGSIITVLGGLCGQMYMKAQLCVKREMSNAKAPVLGHFGAAVAGLTSIRAYGAQESFRQESYKRINRYIRAAVPFYNLNRWLCIRTDALGGLFSTLLATYLVYGSGARASNTGFSLTMAVELIGSNELPTVSFSGMILWWIRVLNDLELNGALSDFTRIQQYLEIEHEPEPTQDRRPPAYWPASGDLKVENLYAKYSPDGPHVLHDVSFEVKAGERVGIVGRTGSGKSSLTLALLRCIITEGRVYYDGIPTDTLNLDALRYNITIIPQVPELLSGTLRQNLDPFDQHDDAVLNDVLRAAGLFSLQSEDDEGRITLDSQIASGGGNLSVGQRQILALARAIVRQSKMLILDEGSPTCSCRMSDFATDSVIQRSLRRELGKDVTLLTVAHRLQTIMDADKILVLDAGRIVEFDTPAELLKNETGILRTLVEESGDKELLFSMAQGAEHSP
ncbi:multidrug resistance-associated ABC transporter [Obba rivulosa]|uniref:Multidrug resistance-associated ABC transporter n=1 Tax=Obba rivulosa TaxID=1052685 RepID=A0A8E2AS08_9APHY|nr:multidrug resistance-associated ABC transporter [Obba rivulosa]